jgi:hypothetical protein
VLEHNPCRRPCPFVSGHFGLGWRGDLILGIYHSLLYRPLYVARYSYIRLVARAALPQTCLVILSALAEKTRFAALQPHERVFLLSSSSSDEESNISHDQTYPSSPYLRLTPTTRSLILRTLQHPHLHLHSWHRNGNVPHKKVYLYTQTSVCL